MSFKDRAIRSLGSLFALMTACAFAQDYDLSALPAYKAAQNQLGVIRVHGSQLVAMQEAYATSMSPSALVACRMAALTSQFVRPRLR